MIKLLLVKWTDAIYPCVDLDAPVCTVMVQAERRISLVGLTHHTCIGIRHDWEQVGTDHEFHQVGMEWIMQRLEPVKMPYIEIDVIEPYFLRQYVLLLKPILRGAFDHISLPDDVDGYAVERKGREIRDTWGLCLCQILLR